MKRMTRLTPPLITVALLASLSLMAQGQSSDPAPPDPQVTASQVPSTPAHGIPILTGYGGFNTQFQSGHQEVEPVVAPILLVPLGKKSLIEAEGEFEGSYKHNTSMPWEHHWDKGLEYAQWNYFATKNLTIVVGRFLTPFGIFNERLHPTWVKNLQETPFVAGIEMTSSNGAMLRGGVSLSPSVNLNYAAYFSTLTQVQWLDATRAAGGRASLFFPGRRLEVGASFQRTLQDQRFNSYGFDLTYQLQAIPLDLRGEYVSSRVQGNGYWLEGAYRMRRVGLARPFMRKSQAVVRWERYHAPGMTEMDSGGMEELPEASTRRVSFGWNYYVREGLKISAAYGRAFSSDGNFNTVSFGIAYRFFFPVGGGVK